LTRIPLTGRSAPPRSRFARVLTAAVAVLAISSSAAFADVAATDAANAAPTPITAPEPTSSSQATPPPTSVVTDPDVTPVVEAPPVVPLTPTAPEPTDAAPPPATPPVVTVPGVPQTAPDAGGTPAPPTVVDVPAGLGPDSAPGATAPATTPAAPATTPDVPAAAPLPAVGLPVAARGADAPPVVTEPAAKPVVLPDAVKPEPVDLTPTLQAFTSRQVTTPATAALPGAEVPVPVQATISPAVAKDEGTTKLVKAFEFPPVQASGSDRSGSILELLAGYVFPGAANSNNGAILLLFSLALLLAVVTPRIPRLHLTTLVAQRGAGCPGYNPVALRPG